MAPPTSRCARSTAAVHGPVRHRAQLFGENQFAVFGDLQAIFLSRMDQDDFTILAEQFGDLDLTGDGIGRCAGGGLRLMGRRGGQHAVQARQHEL